MMSSKNNGFTASDIERYHSGKMSPMERHALEKAALADPFLADALEGYAFTSTPEADLTKIQSRLNEKLDQKKVIPLFQRYKWLSVAALFIIIAGTAWLVYDLSNKGAQQSVAAQKEKKFEENSYKTIPTQQIFKDSSVQSNATAAKKTNGQQEPSASDEKDLNITTTVSNEPSQQSAVVSNSRNNQSNAYYRYESTNSSERSFSSRGNQIGGNEGRARNVQPAEINRNVTASIQRTSDTISLSAITVDDNNKNVVANAPVTRVRRFDQNDTLRHLEIVLQQLPKDSQPALEEVVVTGYGAEKKSIAKYPKVTIDTLEPEEGYVKFDDYVIDNLRMPDELKTKAIAGEVQLAFDVDQNGKPTNITVVKSLCEKCDEEAIRLLKEGPKWKKKKNKKGKITLKF